MSALILPFAADFLIYSAKVFFRADIPGVKRVQEIDLTGRSFINESSDALEARQVLVTVGKRCGNILNILLRPFRGDDLQSMCDIVYRPLVGVNIFGCRVPNKTAHEEFSNNWWGNSFHSVNVVAVEIDSGKIVGAAAIEREDILYFVEPSHWNCGIASHMLTYVLSSFIDEGNSKPINALILRDNTYSIKLIEKFGFLFHGLYIPTSGSFIGRPLLKYIRRS